MSLPTSASSSSSFQIYDWTPEPYENSEDLPDDAPEWLVKHVKEKDEVSSNESGNMVWISCEGENPADRENLGKIEYYPKPGIPKYYFPYKNQPGYLSPIVFAHVTNPKRKCAGGAHPIIFLSMLHVIYRSYSLGSHHPI